MTKILIISKNNNILEEISTVFIECRQNFETFLYKDDEEALFNFINEKDFTAIIIDDEINEYDVILKKLKSSDSKNTMFSALLYTSNSPKIAESDLSGFVDVFIQKPVVKNILISTINSYLKIKKKLDKFKEDNKELNRSLYQLDVLYNTSSKLSGNLDKDRLYEIMFETLEKTLSFDLAMGLFYKDKITPENKLIIHSLKKPDSNTLNVLKEKIISYANENNDKNIEYDFSDIEIKEHIKPSYMAQSYDIKLLSFDKLSAPIKVKDKTKFVISIYRENPFSKEDVVCFQSIIHQISSALTAIVLYNEIKSTNIELKKLERIKTEFVSIVSHELRTPITPISNSLDIIASEQAGKLSTPAQNFLNMAKRNVERLSSIIEDLLDLSRIETGKFDFKYKKYNIKSSLDLIQKNFENQAKTKEINFETSFAENLPDIYADPKRIEQILTNIVTNAFKFTPKSGSVKVSADVINSSDIEKTTLIHPVTAPDGEYIHISIKDTGVGIKEEDIHKIFDKFSQIENSLTRSAGGVGLGLTITKHFIDAHLGSIWVNTKENEGSDFNVIIPVYTPKSVFEIDLNFQKKTSATTSLLTLKSKDNLQCFTENLKAQNIIKPLKNSKEVLYHKNGEYIYKIFFANLLKSAFDFMAEQILKQTKNPSCIENNSAEEISKDRLENDPCTRNYDIVLEKAVFKKEDEEI